MKMERVSMNVFLMSVFIEVCPPLAPNGFGACVRRAYEASFVYTPKCLLNVQMFISKAKCKKVPVSTGQ